MEASGQGLNSLIGLAVLTKNWADATILGMADEAATFDEEIAKLQVAIEERELTLLALRGENPFNGYEADSLNVGFEVSFTRYFYRHSRSEHCTRSVKIYSH